jgi:hypothetical protein
MRIRTFLPIAAIASSFFGLTACAEESGSVPEVPAEELVAEVAELGAVHEFMRPLWHDAFPAKDYELIQELVPQLQPTVEALGDVELPGILQDKQAGWDEGRANLVNAFEGLKAAAEAGNEEDMLGYAETFHMAYEGLVRLIRPPLPELDEVHEHLYGLFHYYGPGYDLEKIRVAATNMAAAIPALQAAELPERLADRQADFEAGVAEMAEAVEALMGTLDDPSRADVEAAVEAVHSAYANVEGIFTNGSHG